MQPFFNLELSIHRLHTHVHTHCMCKSWQFKIIVFPTPQSLQSPHWERPQQSLLSHWKESHPQCMHLHIGWSKIKLALKEEQLAIRHLFRSNGLKLKIICMYAGPQWEHGQRQSGNSSAHSSVHKVVHQGRWQFTAARPQWDTQVQTSKIIPHLDSLLSSHRVWD